MSERVADIYKRFATFVAILLVTSALAGLGTVERWCDRHPTGAKALGAVVWVVLFWLFVRAVQWVGTLL
jgi:hypothetical protein